MTLRNKLTSKNTTHRDKNPNKQNQNKLKKLKKKKKLNQTNIKPNKQIPKQPTNQEKSVNHKIRGFFF